MVMNAAFVSLAYPENVRWGGHQLTHEFLFIPSQHSMELLVVFIEPFNFSFFNITGWGIHWIMSIYFIDIYIKYTLNM